MSKNKNILKTIQERHCKRAFKPKSIKKSILKEVLNAATHAASSKNSQPWQVCILSKKSTKTLSKKLCELFDQNIEEKADYTYMTTPMPDLFKQRARECGYALFKLKNIDIKDYKKRNEHTKENFKFFGAPCTMFFHLHKNAEAGNFLDLGLFLQNIMLGLLEYNLGSCPQYSVTQFSNTIKKFCNIEPDRILVCGLSIGYPDDSNKINSFIPKRNTVESFTNWI
tara:strand:- start:469 stop:1143 length:675 start_codon:yes stop_codon:yes gene_type:complete